MKTGLVRAALGTSAITLALAAAPSHAIAPVLALLGKQLLQDMVMTTAKSMLLDSLRGTGCKGTALANALESVGSMKGGGLAGLGGLGAPGGPGMPSGMAGMPGIAGMAGMPGMGGSSGFPSGLTTMPGLTGSGGMPGMPVDLAAMMAGMLPAGGLDAEQTALLSTLQGGMGKPLSPMETLATIDEMSEIGMLSAATSGELKECLLFLPQSAPAMGMAMGMMKPMLTKFREARDEMHALSIEEQDELAASLAEEFDKVPASDRMRLLTELGGGLFPPRVVETLTRRYGGR